MIGCVAYPFLNLKKVKNQSQIKRLVSNHFFLKNELAIHSILPNNAHYFYIFFEAEKISYQEIDDDTKHILPQKTALLNEVRDRDQVLLYYEPKCFYSLDDVFLFLENGSPLEYLRFTIRLYNHLLNAIDLLNQHNIVNFMCQQKIAMNENQEANIINFEQALLITQSNVNCDYIMPYLSYLQESWPLEFHILHHMNNSDIQIKSLSKIHLETILNKLSIEEEKKEAFLFFRSYINQPLEKLCPFVFKYWHTWNQYTLNKMILGFLTKLDPINTFVKQLKELLTDGSMKNPEKRVSIKESRDRLEQLCYLIQRTTFEEIKFNAF